VEFQVEEDFEAARPQRLDHRRTTAGEQLLADLDAAQRRIKLVGQRQGSLLGGKVEGDDQGRGHGRRLRGWRKVAHCSGAPPMGQPASTRAITLRTRPMPSASTRSISSMVMMPGALPAAGLTTSARQA